MIKINMNVLIVFIEFQQVIITLRAVQIALEAI